MRSSVYTLSLKITGDGKDAVVELENVADATEQVDKKSRKASKGVKVFDNAVEKSKSNLKAWASAAVAAAVALPTVVALNMAKAAMKNAAEVRRLTQSLNINATALTQWQFASETVGISGEKMADIFKDINDRVGDFATTGAGPLADVMQQTNLQIKDLINLSPDQQLLKIYDALDKIDGITHAEKTFYLEALAGDASLLIPLLEDGAAGFEKMAQKADAFGITLSQLDVEKLHIANQQFGIIGQQVDGIGNQLAIGLAPAFYAVMSAINDTAQIHGGWGEVASGVADAIITGIGFVGDAMQGTSLIAKQLKVDYLSLKHNGVLAMSLIGKAVAKLVTLALSPMTTKIGEVTGALGSMARAAGEFTGNDSMIKFATSMEVASRNAKSFKVEFNALDRSVLEARLDFQLMDSELQHAKGADLFSNRLKKGFDASKTKLNEMAQAAVDAKNKLNAVSDGNSHYKGGRTFGKNKAPAAKAAADAIKKSQADQAKATQKAANEIARAEKQKADAAARAAQRIKDAIKSTNQQLDIQIIRMQQGDEAAERQILINKKIVGSEQDAIIVKQNLIKTLEIQAAAQKKVDDRRKATNKSIIRHNKELDREYNKITMLPEAYAQWQLAEEGIKGKIAERILTQQAANDALADAQQQQADFAKSFEDDFLASIKKGKLDFTGFVDHIIDEMLRAQVIKPIMDSIFGSTTAGGGRAGGGLFDGFMSIFGFHDGGIAGAGEQTFTRSAAIPRYHSGGIVQPGEVPAILQKEEGVFTPGQMQAMAPVQPLVNALTNNNNNSVKLDQKVTVKLVNAPAGSEIDSRRQTQDADGNISIDVMFKNFEGRLIGNASRGRGLAKVFQQKRSA